MSGNLVFFDIDGTIAREGFPISPAVREAVKQLQANGDYALVNTGRCRAFLYDDIFSLGFDGIVCAAGARIEFGGKLLSEACIERELLLDTVRSMARQNINTIIEGTEKMLLYRPNCIPHPFLETAKSFEEFEQACKSYKINKFTYYLNSWEQIEPLVPELEKNFEIIVHEKDELGEIVQKGVTKGSAIKKLCGILNIPLSKTYAVGDSLNDLDMLQTAGCAIAMGNAVPELKAAADYVTLPFEEDGAAAALHAVGLI